MPSEPADDMGRIGRSMTHRMNVGDHFRTGIAERGPGLPGFGEKAEIFRTVNPCTWALPEHSGRNQFVLAGLQSREQPVGAFGLFGGALDDAAHQEELRIVAAVQFGIDGLHAGTPLVGNRIPLGAAPASLLGGVSSRTSLPTSRQA